MTRPVLHGSATQDSKGAAAATLRSYLAISQGRSGVFASRAIRALERSLDTCQMWQIVIGIPSVAATLGGAYAVVGRIEEALPLVAGAVGEDARDRQRIRQPAFVLLGAAMTYLLAGRLDDASRHTSSLLAYTRDVGARPGEALALCLAGNVVAATGADEAENLYRGALALAGELGMRPLVAHCHLGLGKLYRRTGRRELAQEHLTTATAMYREMGMTYWLERAEAELKD
jgi:tetratricopeptide (TPR) repeat protein